jgi:NADH-quinone oxidoreductase subunit E
VNDERQSSVAGQPATSNTADRMTAVGDEGALQAAPLPPGWDEGVRLEDDPATIPDPASVEVPESLRTEIERLMRLYPDRHSATLPALGAAQRVHGWCSPEAMQQVAAVMQVTPAYLSSVATFYDMLRTEPTGSRYVYVCTSVACHVRNAKKIYDAIEREAVGQGLRNVELREFECLGACDMAPMASVDGRFVGPLTTDDAPAFVSAVREARTVLPGRGLGDPGYSIPAAPHQDEGPPEEPDVHPAGGTWKEAELLDVPPAAGPAPHGREPLHPLEPGTSVTPEEEQTE